jgi:hypothetical protein
MNYYITNGIGKAKYTVSHHNGTDTHKDGSPFYGIAIFKSKTSQAAFIKTLRAEGYVAR